MKARGPGASDRYRRRIGARASGVDLFEADGLAPVMTQDSRPPATRTLCTQFESWPSIDTR